MRIEAAPFFCPGVGPCPSPGKQGGTGDYPGGAGTGHPRRVSHIFSLLIAAASFDVVRLACYPRIPLPERGHRSPLHHSHLPNASIIIGRAEAADMTCVTESAWGGGNFNTARLQKIPLCMRLGIRGGISSLGAREFWASHYYSKQFLMGLRSSRNSLKVEIIIMAGSARPTFNCNLI